MPELHVASEQSNGILNRLYNYLWKTEKKEVDITMPTMDIRKATVNGNQISVNPANLTTVYTRESDYEDVNVDASDIAKLTRRNFHIASSSSETIPLISIQTPEWGQKYINTFSRNLLNPKIAYKPLDTLQNKLVKEIMIEICDDDPNTMMQNRVDQISECHRRHLKKNGYAFNFIKPDCQHYGQFNTVVRTSNDWYGRYHKPHKY
jgi:hypothetical protein